MPGNALLDLARTAASDLLLVAPYIKVGALVRVLDACPPDSKVSVVTRWRPEELALGVSDIGVWPQLRERHAMLSLHPRLHAKYYASGDFALIGSANLTHAALGWLPNSNLEILRGVDRGLFAEFERSLFETLIPVDDELYATFLARLATFPPAPGAVDPPASGPEDQRQFEHWRPTLRHPTDLFLAYSGMAERLSGAAREAAAADLAVLSIAPSLSQAQFEASVSLMLRQHPEVTAIDDLASEPQRFGAFRSLLSRRGAADGGHAWQTWMRWLLHFFPQDYEMQEVNYSEIFTRHRPEKEGGRASTATVRQPGD